MTEEETKSVEQQLEQPPMEPPTEEKLPATEPAKKKRIYQKRKMKILQDEEKNFKEQNETREEEEPPPKKVRVTKEDEDPPPVEQPSFLRGAIVKPLLLGLLASGSFLVNHMFQTHVPAPPSQKKNTTQKPEILRNETVVLHGKKKNSVPGFD